MNAKDYSRESPGPVMVSLLTRSRKNAHFSSNMKQNRSRLQKSRQKKQDFEPGPYQYLMIVSEEWSERQKRQDRQTHQVTKPEVKVVRNRVMNWFLSYIKKQGVYRFPTRQKSFIHNKNEISPGEKIITIRTRNKFHQIVWDDRFFQRVQRIKQRSKEKANDLLNQKKQIIKAFQSVFNLEDNEKIEVKRGEVKWKGFFKQIQYENEVSKTIDARKKLQKAKRLIRNEKYKKAKQLLARLMKYTSGTTYYHRARGLLQKLQLKEKE